MELSSSSILFFKSFTVCPFLWSVLLVPVYPSVWQLWVSLPIQHVRHCRSFLLSQSSRWTYSPWFLCETLCRLLFVATGFQPLVGGLNNHIDECHRSRSSCKIITKMSPYRRRLSSWMTDDLHCLVYARILCQLMICYDSIHIIHCLRFRSYFLDIYTSRNDEKVRILFLIKNPYRPHWIKAFLYLVNETWSANVIETKYFTKKNFDRRLR